LNLPVLTIASGNQKKVSEISEMLDVLSLRVEKQPDYLNVEETGNTYFENALLKAKAAALETKTWALADDSGLEVDILDGRPGIYSARYANNNVEKIKKLVNELSDCPYRSARFISCMVLCDPSGNLVKDTTGICWGEILKNPKYPNGEFESIFWVKEANCVYGELSQSQLSKLGSRGKAAKIMSPFLKKEIGLN
jgi:non-canonical purine NTP pyrophosphatase (RdgB/HAM1 family)